MDNHLTAFKAMIGQDHVLTAPADMAPYLREWRDRYHGTAACVLRPASTTEVSAIMAYAAQQHLAVVPQGGNTGLVGGQIPFAGELVLSTGRLNRIRDCDPLDQTLIAEAGVTLAAVQAKATDADRLFPLSLASEGSATIGGLVSTNAGGMAVLRYGTMRDLVLGLEVVLPDGQIWNGLRRLRKDNTGYDLKQLFIGAEGTLGIVTAAVLKLFPRPRQTVTAMVALDHVGSAIDLLGAMRASCGDVVTAFELIPRVGMEMVLRHAEGTRDPFTQPYGWYALIEATSASTLGDLTGEVTALLAQSASTAGICDAVIAASEKQASELWRLREMLSEVQRFEGGSIKHDVSVPVSRMPAFIETATQQVTSLLPGIRPVAFGHVGDGNVHFNLSQPVGAARDAFLARWEEFSTLVHGIVASFDGSISAEHGLGVMKVDEIRHHKAAIELDMMARVKRAIDPDGRLNPGKVIRPEGPVSIP